MQPGFMWPQADQGVCSVQLACARIGAVHSVVFAGFSADSLAGRILDSKPSVVLTASAVKRGAKPINLKVDLSRADNLPTCSRLALDSELVNCEMM